MPRKKKAAKAAGAASSKQASKDDLDISSIQIDGDDEDRVPVYDTPKDLQTKITAHMRNSGVSKAAFLHCLNARYHTQKSGDVCTMAADLPFSQRARVLNGVAVHICELRVLRKAANQAWPDRVEGTNGNGAAAKWDLDAKLWMGPGECFYVSQYAEIELVQGRIELEPCKDEPGRKRQVFAP